MLERFDPKISVLPKAQQEIWPLLSPAARLGFVLYGGTAVALYLGHRTSVDFDFFSSEALDKEQIRRSFSFMSNAKIIQDEVNTLVAVAAMPSGDVRVSFFGGIKIGRVNNPLKTRDSALIVASLDDLLATKLKTILDRAEAKDYRDISAMLSSGLSLAKALGAFKRMYNEDPSLPLRAIGFFRDGDLPSLPKSDQNNLTSARDRTSTIPDVMVNNASLDCS